MHSQWADTHFLLIITLPKPNKKKEKLKLTFAIAKLKLTFAIAGFA